MQLEHNQICTRNSEVKIGYIYLYTEGTLECKVKVLQASQQKEGVILSLKVIAIPQNSPLTLGEEFEVLASGSYQNASSWWYLHDQELVPY